MNADNTSGLRDALDFVNRQPCRCMSIAQLGDRDYCDRCQSVKNLRALLARTEAGADGVGQSGAFKMTMRMAEMHAAAILLLRKLDEVHKDPKYMAVWEIAQNHIGPYKGPQYTAELARLRAATVPFEEYTHPQDASGDAEVRELRRVLNKLADYWIAITRDKDVAHRDRAIIDAYDKGLTKCAAELRAAMQAKEAK